MGCLISQLASKFAFFPPSPATYAVKKSSFGELTAVSTASSMPVPIGDDTSLDVLFPSTASFTELVVLDLSQNPFLVSEIPTDIGKLGTLQHLL
ncbi:putative leucine-rich repeat receptor-like protein kinase [Camellia lanceoleosa]|uniref:Leucine-rich repeat receptor-like protein kinase n=1 Tax=Camellia lanceoleosa TaxID=1840588 RepID=A0ACC0FQU8_9ERIC|nr:putative leucine-rich repeat receptor-like protein kinase [Camellia lanceoleosa]